MNWEDYRITYFTFDTGVCQTEIIARAADSILKDFPENIPGHWKEDIDVGIDSYLSILKKEVSEKDDDSPIKLNISEKLDNHFEEDSSGFLEPLLDVYTKLSILGFPLDEISFNNRVYYQQLVMMFSHLDAFLADTLRAICEIKPQVLKSNRKVDWQTVIDATDIEQVREEIVEKFVYEFGWKKVVDRIERIENDFGLNIPISDKTLNVLEIAESSRNLVTHDGGKINKEYINLIKRIADIEIDPEAVGRSMNLSKREVHSYSECVRMTGGAIFEAVSEKFFSKSSNEIIPFKKDPNLL